MVGKGTVLMTLIDVGRAISPRGESELSTTHSESLLSALVSICLAVSGACCLHFPTIVVYNLEL